mmetsp:Transcript_122203/g.260748  ORF Transcript_122203/g.260748 Transcript_122203/m.260748 type:complete len:247 (+) Transcript_122203:89-829(+)
MRLAQRSLRRVPTAATVAPSASKWRHGPTSEFAPKTTKQRPRKSSHSSLAITESSVALVSGSSSPEATHASSCASSAAPVSGFGSLLPRPPAEIGTDNRNGDGIGAPPLTVTVRRVGAVKRFIAVGSGIASSPRTNTRLAYSFARPARATLRAASGLTSVASASDVTCLGYWWRQSFSFAIRAPIFSPWPSGSAEAAATQTSLPVLVVERSPVSELVTGNWTPSIVFFFFDELPMRALIPLEAMPG